MLSALCYGSINPDLVHHLREFPAAGDDVRSIKSRTTYGGGGANPAVALAAWGVATALAGNALGDDPLGRWLIDELAGRGVDVSMIELDAGAVTPHCLVLVGSDGERTIISSGYDGAHWQQVGAETWTGRSVATVDAYSARSGARTIVEASAAGVPTVGLDVTGAAAAPLSVCVWSSHEHETADALALSRSGPDVVLTSGRESAVWCRGGTVVLNLEPPTVQPIDPTGAGDTLAAMVAYGVAARWEPDQILPMAVAAASLTVERERGEPIPDLGTITRLAGTLVA